MRYSVTPSRTAIRDLLIFVTIAAIVFAIIGAYPRTTGFFAASLIPTWITWKAIRRSDRPGTTLWFIFLGMFVGFGFAGAVLGTPPSSWPTSVLYGIVATIPLTFGALAGRGFDDIARDNGWD